MLTPLRVAMMFAILILIALYFPFGLTGAATAETWKVNHTTLLLESGESAVLDLKALGGEDSYTLGTQGPLNAKVHGTRLVVRAPASYKGVYQLVVYDTTAKKLLVEVVVE